MENNDTNTQALKSKRAMDILKEGGVMLLIAALFVLSGITVFASSIQPKNSRYSDYSYVGMNMPMRAVTEKAVEMGRVEFPVADVIIPTIFLSSNSDMESECVDGVFCAYAYEVIDGKLVLRDSACFSGTMKFGYENGNFCIASFSEHDVNLGYELSDIMKNQERDVTENNYLSNFGCSLFN